MASDQFGRKTRFEVMAAALEREATAREKDASWLGAWLAWEEAANAWAMESALRAAQAQKALARSREALSRTGAPKRGARSSCAVTAWKRAAWMARATSEWVRWMAREKVGLEGLAQESTWLAWVRAAEATAPKPKVTPWEKAWVKAEAAWEKSEAMRARAAEAREKVMAQG
jgi:hypothetical protein